MTRQVDIEPVKLKGEFVYTRLEGNPASATQVTLLTLAVNPNYTRRKIWVGSACQVDQTSSMRLWSIVSFYRKSSLILRIPHSVNTANPSKDFRLSNAVSDSVLNYGTSQLEDEPFRFGNLLAGKVSAGVSALRLNCNITNINWDMKWWNHNPRFWIFFLACYSELPIGVLRR